MTGSSPSQLLCSARTGANTESRDRQREAQDEEDVERWARRPEAQRANGRECAADRCPVYAELAQAPKARCSKKEARAERRSDTIAVD